MPPLPPPNEIGTSAEAKMVWIAFLAPLLALFTCGLDDAAAFPEAALACCIFELMSSICEVISFWFDRSGLELNVAYQYSFQIVSSISLSRLLLKNEVSS